MNKFIKIVLIIAVIAALIFGCYEIFKTVRKDQGLANSVATLETDAKKDIEEKYYEYLNKAKNDLNNLDDYGLEDNVSEVNISFVTPSNSEDPVLVAQYDQYGQNYITIYYEDKNGDIEDIEIDEPAQLVYMYNIKTNSFNYYIEEIDNEDNVVKIISIDNLIDSDTKDSTLTAYNYSTKLSNTNARDITSHLAETTNETYIFTITDVPSDITDATRDVANDFYKFDEVFIVPETVSKVETTKINFKDDVEKFKQDIKSAYDKMKDKAQLNTEELKKEIDTKLEIIKNKIKADMNIN